MAETKVTQNEIDSTVNPQNIVSVLSNYTIAPGDVTVNASAATGSITITFPSAATFPRRKITVKKYDTTSNSITLQPQSGQSLDGASNFVVTLPYNSVTYQSDGTNWWRVDAFVPNTNIKLYISNAPATFVSTSNGGANVFASILPAAASPTNNARAANFFTAGRTIETYASGLYNIAAATTMNIGLYLNSTQLAVTSMGTGLGAITNAPFELRAYTECITTGTTGTFVTTGRLDLNGTEFFLNKTTTTTFDTTAAVTIDVKSAWSVTNASSNIITQIANMNSAR